MEHALFATLLHSLWLGIILSVCTGLVIIFTRKSTAVLRYNLLVGCLGFFLVSVTALFFKELPTSPINTVPISHIGYQQNTTKVSAQEAVTDTFIAKSDNLFQIFNNYSAQIVLIWFLMICIKSVQLIIGLQSISYIKKTKVFPAGAYWEDQLHTLAKHFELSRPVQLLQSGITKVPVIVGHLKPVILVPLGMLNGLSAKEIEAILCHELAHVKRQDYLVNLLQSFAEILFFFNPAVLWVSKLIREERENCCDDLALTVTSNKNEYIHALISCEEFDATKMNYAMAFGKKRNHLMDRVSRIVFNKSTSLNRIEKLVLIILLGTGIVVASAFKAVRPEAPVHEKLSTTIPKSKKTIVINTDSTTTKEIIVAEKKKKILILQEEIEKMTLPEVPQVPEIKDSPINPNTYIKVNANVNVNSRINIDKSVPIAITPKVVVVAEIPVSPEVNLNTKTTTTRSITVNGDHIEKDEFSENVMKNITDDLLSAGIIKQTKSLSYKISPKELIVNGVMQSKELHETFKTRYLKKPDRSILYNFEISKSSN